MTKLYGLINSKRTNKPRSQYSSINLTTTMLKLIVLLSQSSPVNHKSEWYILNNIEVKTKKSDNLTLSIILDHLKRNQ